MRTRGGSAQIGKGEMGRLFKLLVFLILIGIVALIGYAYLGDLAPSRVEVNQPVEVDAN